MGYSHQWDILDATSWQNNLPSLVDDCRKIINTANIRVEPGVGWGPILDRERGIQFNGSGDDGHEDFFLSNGAGSCKTNRKPYDLVVCAILLRAYQLVPDAIKISSDGRWEDWEEASRIVSKLWPGKTLVCPWDEEEEIREAKVLGLRVPKPLSRRRYHVGVFGVRW